MVTRRSHKALDSQNRVNKSPIEFYVSEISFWISQTRSLIGAKSNLRESVQVGII